jgi:UTP--glucose-1-phosphate uridylyltransferase
VQIRKAVIPAAGLGTRMLPAAKAVPKEMLPIVDRPVIQYVVEEAVEAGIDNVLLIISRGKQAIEDHFDRSPELERRLKSVGREALLSSIQRLSSQVTIHSVRQAEQRGLGDAVLQAKKHIGSEPFLCLLGDAVFSGATQDMAAEAPTPGRQLVAAYREFGTSVIGLEEVPVEKVSRYGIVGGTQLREGVLKLDRFVEKPLPNDAPSRLAIAARYVLTAPIFECLEQTTPGKGGEIQLTDALKLLANREPVHGVVLRGTRHDLGNPIDWLKTNLLFAARNPATWAAIAPLVRECLEE